MQNGNRLDFVFGVDSLLLRAAYRVQNVLPSKQRIRNSVERRGKRKEHVLLVGSLPWNEVYAAAIWKCGTKLWPK